MTSWNPGTYLQFADERSRPFLDLIAPVPGQPRTIVDLGCGPGHLTQVLLRRWPDASVVGIDSSPEMIERARRDDTDPRSDYRLADVADPVAWRPDAPVDLIVSNALFQWVPRADQIIPGLRDLVAPGGSVAIQMPANFGAPSHRLLREVARSAPFAAHTRDVELRDTPTAAETLLGLLSGAGWQVDAWTTTYLHVLHGPDPVFHWISGTGARPVLQALPADLLPRFTATYQAALREAYPERPFGTVLPFERAFVVATRNSAPPTSD